jgi:DNA-binding MarR family transcriptional regulator
MLPNSFRRVELSNGIVDVGRLDELLVVHLSRLDILLSQAFYTATEQERLRPGVISSLALIVANPGISQNEIGRYTGIDKSAMVPIIDYLEESGYVVREKSREDRRRYALRATSEGEDRLESLVDAVKKIENDMLAKVSKKEIETFQNLVDRMVDSCLAQGMRFVRRSPNSPMNAAQRSAVRANTHESPAD